MAALRIAEAINTLCRPPARLRLAFVALLQQLLRLHRSRQCLCSRLPH
ncbi:hypothetical protein MOTT12_05092 [Mycobacterium intracellulare subsp. yongonense]|nr:hypothetical protein MOTT12_05092 [Mycobacterium intracellulare subsp. yongonense]